MGGKLDKIIYTAKGILYEQNVQKIVGVQKWLSIYLISQIDDNQCFSGRELNN